jgi:hypothetical protein
MLAVLPSSTADDDRQGRRDGAGGALERRGSERWLARGKAARMTIGLSRYRDHGGGLFCFRQPAAECRRGTVDAGLDADPQTELLLLEVPHALEPRTLIGGMVRSYEQ